MSNFIVEAFILLTYSVVLIRIAGKKTVAQMTGLETVIILAVGTTMGHAIKEYKFWQVIVVLSAYVLFLIIVQRLQLKFNFLENYLIGKATIVINEGRIIEDNLVKLRITKEQLEMRLRQHGISFISDVKIGTIESNGEFGYELSDDAKPITQSKLNEILKGKKIENLHKDEENIFQKVLKDNT
ncbi:DUF421 domain-containing protein [Niallia oryzisoli]|uniref:DUF421 domain-containing protein n=1 Tax=Niallia oryzisoli TaxID=1737571 RepID=UPI003735810C